MFFSLFLFLCGCDFHFFQRSLRCRLRSVRRQVVSEPFTETARQQEHCTHLVPVVHQNVVIDAGVEPGGWRQVLPLARPPHVLRQLCLLTRRRSGGLLGQSWW